jgi:NitT/TauT family transport system substrate-binding protein
MKTATVRLLWYPQPQFAGVILAERLGLARARGVEIVTQPIDFARPPVAAVLAGEADFCIASPAHALESTAPDQLFVLLVVQQDSPLAYPARRADGIARLADLAGRRAAVWPGNEHLELRAMLAAGGVPPDSLSYVAVPDTVETWLAGGAELAQTTVYHELPHLLHGVGAEEIVVFRGRDQGIDLAKDGLIVRRDRAEADPLLTQAVVDAILEGWTLALKDPDAAIAACRAARPDMPEGDQREQLAAILGLIRSGANLDHGLGYPDPAHAARAADAMRLADPGHRPPSLARLCNTQFWNAAPAAFRQKVTRA